MKKILVAATLLFAAALCPAQPLPQIALKPVFPKLQDERPIWLSEAPDHSGRFFIVYQPGKILVVKKSSDGGDAKVFLTFKTASRISTTRTAC